MRKYIICLLVIIFIAVIILVNNFDDSSSSKKVTKKSNTLTMMLETGIGSNEYEISNSNTWPTEGYIFNDSKSYCELGSKILWDNERKRLSLKT